MKTYQFDEIDVEDYLNTIPLEMEEAAEVILHDFQVWLLANLSKPEIKG